MVYLKKKEHCFTWLRFEGLIILVSGGCIGGGDDGFVFCLFCFWILWDLCSGLKNPLLVETSW